MLLLLGEMAEKFLKSVIAHLSHLITIGNQSKQDLSKDILVRLLATLLFKTVAVSLARYESLLPLEAPFTLELQFCHSVCVDL